MTSTPPTPVDCPYCGADLEDDLGGMWCPAEEVFIPDSELPDGDTWCCEGCRQVSAAGLGD